MPHVRRMAYDLFAGFPAEIARIPCRIFAGFPNHVWKDFPMTLIGFSIRVDIISNACRYGFLWMFASVLCIMEGFAWTSEGFATDDV